MKAVVTVIGKDTVGILSKVSGTVSEANANVIEVTQSVLDDYFAMIMVIEISDMIISLEQLHMELNQNLQDMKIHVMHQDIFSSMHEI